MDPTLDTVERPFPLPDYHGTSIVNLMSSLRLGLGAEPAPRSASESASGPAQAAMAAYPPLAALPPEYLARYTNVVLLVVDGLGHDFLAGYPDSFLRRHQHSRLTSVFPTTTATAITTYLTGLAPQQHGLTGWFVWLRELDSITAVLPFRPRTGGPDHVERGVDPHSLFDAPPLFDTLQAHATIITQAALIDSAYTQATRGHASRIGYQDLDGLFTGVHTALANPLGSKPHRFVYAYWPRLDGLAHAHGIHSRAVDAHFRHLDKAVAQLARSLAGGDTLLLVCADHGFVDIMPERRIQLEDHPRLARTLARPLCGEPRAAYCYLRPGQHRAFEDYVGGELATLCTPVSSEQALDEGWFGLGTPHPRLHERIGDVILLMHDGAIIKDHLPGEPPFTLRGVHGGLSPAELYVPLIVYPKGR